MLPCEQIPCEKGNGTCRLNQSIRKRKRVIKRQCLLDIFFGHAHSLIGKSLKPQDPRKKGPQGNAMVDGETQIMGLVKGIDRAPEHALDLPS